MPRATKGGTQGPPELPAGASPSHSLPLRDVMGIQLNREDESALEIVVCESGQTPSCVFLPLPGKASQNRRKMKRKTNVDGLLLEWQMVPRTPCPGG